MAGPVTRFGRGDVVVVPFPFSDLSQAKRRPALVVAAAGSEDVILCQITSRAIRDGLEVGIDRDDFASGSLHQPSNVRPNRLFTADRRILMYSPGTLNTAAMTRITDRLVQIVRGER
jgi:mRNA interferase MazF